MKLGKGIDGMVAVAQIAVWMARNCIKVMADTFFEYPPNGRLFVDFF